ncbi:hypothetical protein DRO32_03210 [Candidatus Bathyarchaeota archaeon]|nr:MAG: hypothetical protein DRO32_03210 [Candidatus Bathyarchaeota archaeon]
MRPPELSELEQVCSELRELGHMRFSHLARLYRAFGPRLASALEALRERRVKKYVFRPSGRVVWVVVGREREYVVLPRAPYCSCDDFYFRVLDGRARLCYHIIAQRLAECLNWYEEVEEEDEDYEVLVGELREVEAGGPVAGRG